MKYRPELYAKAFAEVAAGKHTPAEKAKLVKNFFAIILKNNDTHELKKIFGAAEKMMRGKTGIRKITIESARETKKSPRAILKHFLKKTDVVETKINPDLVAGIKIIINDNEQFDGSLRRKINKLFF